MNAADPAPVLRHGQLYFGDNGRIFCRDHAGAMALYTGRDISGQRVAIVTPADREAWKTECPHIPLDCEDSRHYRRRHR